MQALGGAYCTLLCIVLLWLLCTGLSWGQGGVWPPSSTVEVQHPQAWPRTPVPHHCHWLCAYAVCGCCWSGGAAESRWHKNSRYIAVHMHCSLTHTRVWQSISDHTGQAWCMHVCTHANRHWAELMGSAWFGKALSCSILTEADQHPLIASAVQIFCCKCVHYVARIT